MAEGEFTSGKTGGARIMPAPKKPGAQGPAAQVLNSEKSSGKPFPLNTKLSEIKIADERKRQSAAPVAKKSQFQPKPQPQVPAVDSEQVLFDKTLKAWQQAQGVKRDKGSGSPDYQRAYSAWENAANLLASKSSDNPDIALDAKLKSDLAGLLRKHRRGLTIKESRGRLSLVTDRPFMHTGEDLAAFFDDNFSAEKNPRPPEGLVFGSPDLSADRKKKEEERKERERAAEDILKALESKEQAVKNAQAAKPKPVVPPKPIVRPKPLVRPKPAVQPRPVARKDAAKRSEVKISDSMALVDCDLESMGEEKLGSVISGYASAQAAVRKARAHALSKFASALSKSRTGTTNIVGVAIKNIREDVAGEARAANSKTQRAGGSSLLDLHNSLAYSGLLGAVVNGGDLLPDGAAQFVRYVKRGAKNGERALVLNMRKAYEASKKSGDFAGELKKIEQEKPKSKNLQSGIGASRMAIELAHARIEEYAQRLTHKMRSLNTDSMTGEARMRQMCQIADRIRELMGLLDYIVINACVYDIGLLLKKRSGFGVSPEYARRLISEIDEVFYSNSIADEKWLESAKTCKAQGDASARIERIKSKFGDDAGKVASIIAGEAARTEHEIGALKEELAQSELLLRTSSRKDGARVERIRSRLAEARKKNEKLADLFDYYVSTGSTIKYRLPNLLPNCAVGAFPIAELGGDAQDFVLEYERAQSAKRQPLMVGQAVLRHGGRIDDELTELYWKRPEGFIKDHKLAGVTKADMNRMVRRMVVVEWLMEFGTGTGKRTDHNAVEVYSRSLARWKEKSSTPPNLAVQRFAASIDSVDFSYILERRLPNLIEDKDVVIIGSNGKFEIHRAKPNAVLGDETRIMGSLAGFHKEATRGLEKNPYEGISWQHAMRGDGTVQAEINIDDIFSDVMGRGGFKRARGLDMEGADEIIDGELDAIAFYGDAGGKSILFLRNNAETVSAFHNRVLAHFRRES